MFAERASQRAAEPDDDEIEALLAAEEEIAGEWARPRAFDDEPTHDPHDVLFLGLDEADDAMDVDASEPAPAPAPAPGPAPPRAAPVFRLAPPTAPAAGAAPASLPKYIPAEPMYAVSLDGRPLTIPRRRRTRGWTVRGACTYAAPCAACRRTWQLSRRAARRAHGARASSAAARAARACARGVE